MTCCANQIQELKKETKKPFKPIVANFAICLPEKDKKNVNHWGRDVIFFLETVDLSCGSGRGCSLPKSSRIASGKSSQNSGSSSSAFSSSSTFWASFSSCRKRITIFITGQSFWMPIGRNRGHFLATDYLSTQFLHLVGFFINLFLCCGNNDFFQVLWGLTF